MGLTACLALWTPGAATAAASGGGSGISSYGPDYLIKDDGTLWVWGETKSVPTQVHGLSDVQASFPLYYSAMVATKDGSVWKWESNARTMAIEVKPVPELKNITSFQRVYPVIWQSPERVRYILQLRQLTIIRLLRLRLFQAWITLQLSLNIPRATSLTIRLAAGSVICS